MHGYGNVTRGGLLSGTITSKSGRSYALILSAEAERFGWLERPGDDFPYYRDWPVGISTGGWQLVPIDVALGFVALTQGPKLVGGVPAKFIVVFLYWAIPLAVLALVAVLFAAEHLPTYN